MGGRIVYVNGDVETHLIILRERHALIGRHIHLMKSSPPPLLSHLPLPLPSAVAIFMYFYVVNKNVVGGGGADSSRKRFLRFSFLPSVTS